MKKSEKKEDAQTSAPTIEVSAEDRAFEAEICKRNPSRKRIMRFDFPPEVDEAVAVYMFEIKAKDELLAAEMADANMTDTERKSRERANEAEKREAMRLSIVGLVMKTEDGHAGERRIIDQTVPLMELDDWSSKAWFALRTFFGDLNGLPLEELGNSLRGARKLGVAATRLPAGQPSAVSSTAGGG